jgi:hypothetical protein
MIYGILLVTPWRGSGFSSQSVLEASIRGRHRLDGVENHAFGRAFGHSRQTRLHPDHVRAGTLLLGLEVS